MKIKFVGWLHSYYFVVLLLVAGFVIYGSRYFVSNGDEMLSVYEAAVRFDKLEEEGPFVEIKNLINFARSEDASRTVSLLDKEIRFLDSVVPLESYKSLESHLGELGKVLTELPLSEQLSLLQRRFYQKNAVLEKLAEEHKWKGVERISKRLKAKIQGSERFALNNISQLLKNIEEDINLVGRSAVKKPVLKTVNFDEEMVFLNRYIEDSKSIDSIWDKANKSYVVWKRGLSPEISLKKIDLTKKLKNIFWGTVALLLFILFALGGGWLIGRMLEKSIRKKFEFFTTKIVKEGLFPVERKIDIKLSPAFETHFENLREYFHKRLGFGAMVQEAMPFPVLLLDSNLNLLWANKLFYKKWNLENNEIPLSWDYLSQFTDLKGDNPILAALDREVAGIYNIRVFTDSSNKDKGEAAEMYVRPVGYGNKKRVMVLFYPLSLLEATLADKKKEFVKPVIETLDTLAKGEYNLDFEQTVAKDFDDAGIGDIFENFHSHYSLLKDQKSELKKEMGKVESILDEQYELASELKMLLKSDKEVVVQSLRSFSRFKKSLVNIIGMREQLEEAYRQSIYTVQNLFKENEKILSGSEQMIENINKNKEIFQSLVNIGRRLKETQDPLELSKNIQWLNVTLAKGAMLLEDSEVPELGRSVRQIRQGGDFFQEGMKNLDNMGEEFRGADNMMIDCLREFYNSFKSLQKNMVDMGDFVGKLDALNKNYTTTNTV